MYNKESKLSRIFLLWVPLVLFLLFNKQIVAGMTAGSVKG